MAKRRGFAAGLMHGVCCGLTLAAIGLAVAAAYGTIGQAGLAAAVALVAFVQLSVLIGNWRRMAPVAVAHGPQSSKRPAAVPGQDQAGWAVEPEEPEELQMTRTTSPQTGVGDAPGDAAGAPDEAAEPATAGIDLLEDGQVDLYLEPLVELAETRTVYYRANLALTRHDGSRIGPYLLSLSAARGGFASALDLALFRRVCPVIRHLKARARRPGVFCPLSPQSFAEREILDELVEFLKANQEAAGAMVIEISQPDLAALSPAGMDGLAYLAELGATLSLGEARLEGPDPATLVLLGFRFLEFDVAALAGTHGRLAFEEDGDIARLARRAEDAGLTVIAANVSAGEELERLRPFVRLARGPLFSPPRIVRRDIADQPARAAAA